MLGIDVTSDSSTTRGSRFDSRLRNGVSLESVRRVRLTADLQLSSLTNLGLLL